MSGDRVAVENDFLTQSPFEGWKPPRKGFDLRVAFFLDDHFPRMANWWWRRRDRRWARQLERR